MLQGVPVTVVPPPPAGGAADTGSLGERTDFFISYAGPDRPWARWVAALLEANDLTVEIDEWDWPPGCDVVQRMNLALQHADRVLALCHAATSTRPPGPVRSCPRRCTCATNSNTGWSRC